MAEWTRKKTCAKSIHDGSHSRVLLPLAAVDLPRFLRRRDSARHLSFSLTGSAKTGAPDLVAAHRRGSPFGPFDRALSKRSNQSLRGPQSRSPPGPTPPQSSPIPAQQLWWMEAGSPPRESPPPDPNISSGRGWNNFAGNPPRIGLPQHDRVVLCDCDVEASRLVIELCRFCTSSGCNGNLGHRRAARRAARRWNAS